ncbi:DUF6985 domain-containing protein [Kineococcus sp. SYSU DK005]|uniref:DUF6985 domain-containing protein n=1 Tax=Kineococcus sp. SYSU DK005 TaxID=3383126 RepID=UPI003D7EEC78
MAITLPPVLVPDRTATEPARTYLSSEGKVSWEREHGLQLVVEGGVRIGKVGSYNGHVTHADALAELSPLGIFYRRGLSTSVSCCRSKCSSAQRASSSSAGRIPAPEAVSS